MPPKTAKQIIEDEVKEFRRELMRELTKRGELRGMGYETWEIDDLIEEEKAELEKEVEEHRNDLLANLPERERQLDEHREYIFAKVAFEEIWLPQCLEPAEGQSSGLVTKTVYEHYLAWASTVGIANPYSLNKVRPALRDHYGIEDIRTGLKVYQLVNISTKINRGQIISRHEAKQRQLDREYARLRESTCQYCERRKYDGNRFDRCYWCHRILKDGFQTALSEYLAQDVGWERTGNSMHLAHQRMIANGEIPPPTDRVPTPPPNTQPRQDPQPRAIRPSTTGDVRKSSGPPSKWLLVGIALFVILLISALVNLGA